MATKYRGKGWFMRTFRVGELAKRTGLTVRTLHHYDEIGLLAPARRTPAGYRQYDEADVMRLQQIVSLRQLGLSLDEIRACMERPDVSASTVLGMHLRRLRQDVERQQALVRRLEALAHKLDAAEEVSVDEFLRTIEAMTMFEKYYTPEQLAQLDERRRTVGEEHIRAVEAEWPRLIAEVRVEMEKGTDPHSDRVQKMAARWMELVQEFTGGDAKLFQSLNRMYEQEPSVRERTGLDDALMAYVRRAVAHGQEPADQAP